MTRKTKYRGLCLTCRNDPTCKLPRVSSLPVEECEEFVSLGSGGERTMHKEAAGSTGRETVAGAAVEAAKEMGLCATCENRETCTFPNAGKDIHLCEEYQ